MQQEDTDPTQDPAVYSATVTHIALPTRFTAHLLPEDRRAAVLERTEARIVTIVLGAVSPQAGPRHLEHVFGWPKWHHPKPPETGERWSAVFNSESRSWDGMLQTNPGGPPKIVHAGPYATKVTDQMWQMLHDTGTVLLCGGLRGDPTGPEIGAAIARGKMHAVLARVLRE